ncbi:MAG: sigma-70 family RNA polymerase sigma factor [Planctomycetota bacterium]
MGDTEFSNIESAVGRLIDGDEDARESLLKLSYERLQRLTSKMLRQYPVVRRWEQTDDIFQRAAMRLWNALSKIQPEDSRHYFNLAALQVRRELIDVARSLSGPMGIAANYETIGDEENTRGPVVNAGDRQTEEPPDLAEWTEFHEAVDRLDEDLRETFQLIWYQGLTQEAVAKLTGVPQRTISRRWQKSRRELYAILNRQLPG